jgi:5-methyltetrahydrofolate--homocysteine methyltransferase
MPTENDVAEAIASCQQERVKALVTGQLEQGVPAAEVLAQCNRGMIELGDRFGRGDCFLPELMFGGVIMKWVTSELQPRLTAEGPAQTVGKAVMGTVHHDVHDIGKDIVVMMLRGVGFDVVDLGVDVPPATFVEAVSNHHPAVVGMSVLLTTCYASVTATVGAIRDAGLRDGLSLMVGGAAASDLLSEKSGCDFYGKTAVDGVKYASSLVGLS